MTGGQRAVLLNSCQIEPTANTIDISPAPSFIGYNLAGALFPLLARLQRTTPTATGQSGSAEGRPEFARHLNGYPSRFWRVGITLNRPGTKVPKLFTPESKPATKGLKA